MLNKKHGDLIKTRRAQYFKLKDNSMIIALNTDKAVPPPLKLKYNLSLSTHKQ